MFETLDRSPRTAHVAPADDRRNDQSVAADPSFAVVMTRLQALALGPCATQGADACAAPQAVLRACLLDLDRIHAGCGHEAGRRRRLELEVFDARVSRLFAAQRSASRRASRLPTRSTSRMATRSACCIGAEAEAPTQGGTPS